MGQADITEQTGKPTKRGPLRYWPGVVAACLLALGRFGVPRIVPGFEGFRIAAIAGLLGVLAIVAWWLFLSRAPRAERWGEIPLMGVVLAATWRLNHASMGLMWCVFYGIPILMLAWVAWAVASRRQVGAPRNATMIATIVLASLPWTAVRMDGLTGDHVFQFAWRWTKTPEERLLAQTAATAPPPAAPVPVTTGADWPGFRGSGRDGIVRGVRIETDWTVSPPVELWRRPVGPGWSSFAVRGDLLYTQEQRGDHEVVACYDASSGDSVWQHRDAARFYESMGGAGPRATPALRDGRVYAFGATGILNALDADSGAVVWSRSAVSDTGARVPIWGFTSSPLLTGDLVIIAVAGQLVAYDVVTGAPRWSGPDGGPSYSSPHLATIDGVAQIVLLSGAGATGLAPVDGAVLWQSPWRGTPMVQPALAGDGHLLTSAGEGYGVRLLKVFDGPRGWTAEERWTSIRLKPNFNDLVIHRGHAFGFDGGILASIDLEDGERVWKGGRYGQGQLVLLSDQNVLLVVSEKGELVLVEASAEAFTELARWPAIEGKTWNHPVVIGDRLLVRNSQEMAAFRLPTVDD